MSPAGVECSPTFRDPAGSLAIVDGHVYRFVRAEAADTLRSFLVSETGRDLVASGKVVATEILQRDNRNPAMTPLSHLIDSLDPEIICEHERIPFPTYPYEWCPEMLHAAGSLTIELARRLRKEGLGLKDATPYNVLFRGPSPVFVDVLSFERRDPGNSIWLAHAQFIRTFVLPLVANRYYGLQLSDVFLNRRDGLEPEEVYRWTKWHQRVRPPFLSAVSLPAWFGKGRQINHELYSPKPLDNPEKAAFVYDTLLSRSERSLRRLEPSASTTSNWSDYATVNNNYSAEQALAKKQFVAEAIGELRPRQVLDVGCNTGQFSRIAAEAGADVVAIDYDPVVVGRVWRHSKEAKLPILPLVVNLSRPTPATGWRNEECPSFLTRATGAFDLVMMLAVIHHMLVTDRIPLHQVIETASRLTREWAVIEFVGPGDSMFRKLTRGRDHLHASLSPQTFAANCAPFFDIVRTVTLPGSERSLYLLRKKDAGHTRH